MQALNKWYCKRNSEKLGLFSGYSSQGGFVRGIVIRTGLFKSCMGFIPESWEEVHLGRELPQQKQREPLWIDESNKKATESEPGSCFMGKPCLCLSIQGLWTWIRSHWRFLRWKTKWSNWDCTKQGHIFYYCITIHITLSVVSIFFPFTAFTLQKIPTSDQCKHLLSRLLDLNLDSDLLKKTIQPHTVIHN